MIQFPSIPKKITTILWDMDGVLVNSEEIWESLYPQFLKTKFGITNFDPDDFALVVGKTLPMVYRSLCEQYPPLKNFSEQDFIQAECDYAIDKIYPHTRMYPGVLDFLITCKTQGIPMGLVSSSPEAWIQSCLEQHHLHRYFKILISGFAINISKPDPQIYLLAAEQMNVSPSECLVIEDSESGITAGKNAGMSVWKFDNKFITPL